MSLRPVPAPITMADPHDGITPHAYVIIERSQYCVCCGRTHKWSELYAQTYLRATLGLGRMVENLRRLVWPKYRLPIRQLPSKAVERLPFCHACYHPTLEHSFELLEPPSTDAKRIIGFTASQPTKPPKPSEPKSESKSTKKSTVQDLMELLK